MPNHVKQSVSCRTATGAPAQILAPLTHHTVTEVADNIADDLDNFASIKWSDIITNHINTTADLSVREIHRQAQCILDPLHKFLETALTEEDQATADCALKAIIGLVLTMTHVSPNSKIETEEATFHTPNPNNVAKTAETAIKAFREGKGAECLQAHLEASRKARERGGDTDEGDRRITAAITAASHGHLSKAMRTLASNGLAPATEETAVKLQETYYPAPGEAVATDFVEQLKLATDMLNAEQPQHPGTLYRFTSDEINAAIDHIAEGTAADAIGLRPGHMRILCELRYTHLINLICSFYLRGKLPAELQSILGGGMVIPLVKRPEDQSIRPIVITYILPKIVENIMTARHQAKISDTLIEPVQLGVGVAHAVTILAWAARAAFLKNPSNALVQFDFSNAYGTISRALILKELIKRKNLDLIRVFVLRYGATVRLNMTLKDGVHRHLDVNTGILQGDALAPLFFCIGVHTILQRLHSREAINTEIMGAFLDDLTCGGPPDKMTWLVNNFQRILNEEKSGLTLNMEKTLYLSPSDIFDRDNPPHCRIVPPNEGIFVLGVPVGSPEWVRDATNREVASWAPLLVSIERLPAQHALLLLRLCIVQKYNFIQRHVPPSLIGQSAQHLHDTIWETLRTILDIPTDNTGLNIGRARRIAELPLRVGGLGLQNPTHTRGMAFLAGFGDIATSLQQYFPALHKTLQDRIVLAPPSANTPPMPLEMQQVHADIHEGLMQVRNNLTTAHNRKLLGNITQDQRMQWYPSTPQELLHNHSKLQRSYTNLLQNIAHDDLLNSLDDPQRAVLLSESSSGASAWLCAVPSSRSLFMPTDNFRVAVRDRLMIPPLNGPVPECSQANCPLAHLDPSDTDAAARELRRHKHGVGACARHARVVKQISLMLESVNIRTVMEPKVRRSPELRGDLAEHDTHNRGFNTIYDVSVTDPTKADTLQDAARKAGTAAQSIKKIKNLKYLQACKDIDAHFYPLIFETSGYIDKSVFDLITTISRNFVNEKEHIPEFTTWAAPSFKHYWLQRITIALRGGSADMTQRNWKSRQEAFLLSGPD